MREKDRVCRQCETYIAAGHQVEAAAQRALEAGTQTPVRWHEVDYAGPGYYGCGVPTVDGRDYQKELQHAFHVLVMATSEPAPATTSAQKTQDKYIGGSYKSGEQWPYVLERTRSRHSNGALEWVIRRLMRPEVREALAAFDNVLVDTLEATYMAGKASGASVLQGLARGEVSLHDFDESLMTPEERAEREKARRGY